MYKYLPSYTAITSIGKGGTLKLKAGQEQVKFWCVPDLDNLELLHATYITHAFARHTHETFAIGVIEQGAAAFDRRGATHIASTGNVVAINPGEAHACHTVIEKGYTYRMMYPSVALLQQVTSEITGRQQDLPSFSTPIIQDEQLTQLVCNLHITLETSTCQLERESSLSWSLAQLIKRHADEHLVLRRVGRERQAVRQAKEYLEAHYADNVSLEKLANIANLSPFHLTRVFCHEVGLPPHVYLTQVRILRAKKLLSQGWAIAQVALETGFAHQSHLNRHFKRLVGITPRQYKIMSKNVQDR